MTSKPSSAKRGSCSRTPSKPPHDRGKSSYHDPKRASGRSTSTSYVSDHVFSERSPVGSASASSTVTSRRLRRTAPSESSPARSVCPAVTLRCSSVWNEATRSTHASMRKHQRPGRSTSNVPVHRSLPCGTRGDSVHRVEPGRRYRIAAPSVSWPSRKIRAETATGSPTVRLTGQRPQSTCGSTAWIWIRAGRVFGSGTHQVSPMRKDRSVRLARSAGVFLHPTSLPSGRLDREAYRFVDWLAAAGHSWWQILPLGPPDEHHSPYASPSAFAASPALLAKPNARVTAAD